MLETGLAQLRFATSIVFGTSFSLRAFVTHSYILPDRVALQVLICTFVLAQYDIGRVIEIPNQPEITFS